LIWRDQSTGYAILSTSSYTRNHHNSIGIEACASVVAALNQVERKAKKGDRPLFEKDRFNKKHE
jgi:hypothetical protein